MVSTMERDFVVKNGVATFPMKSYPDWYGISGIGYIWHNSWTDPELEYKGKRINIHLIEDTMWNRWIHDDDETLNADREKDTDGFSEYMNTNSDDVYKLLDAIIGEKRY